MNLYNVQFFHEGQTVAVKNRYVEARDDAEAAEIARRELGVNDDTLRASPQNLGVVVPTEPEPEKAVSKPQPAGKEKPEPEKTPPVDVSKTVVKTIGVTTDEKEPPKVAAKKKG